MYIQRNTKVKHNKPSAHNSSENSWKQYWTNFIYLNFHKTTCHHVGRRSWQGSSPLLELGDRCTATIQKQLTWYLIKKIGWSGPGRLMDHVAEEGQKKPSKTMCWPPQAQAHGCDLDNVSQESTMAWKFWGTKYEEHGTLEKLHNTSCATKNTSQDPVQKGWENGAFMPTSTLKGVTLRIYIYTMVQLQKNNNILPTPYLLSFL
jgi:hypothetical protein